MSKSQLLAAAGIAALTLSSPALAQYGPPPPGSAQGTESGTYGSSIGFDVRGTGSVDRFGRAYDPMNPTDVGTKAAEEARKKADRRDSESDRGGDVPSARGAGAPRASNAPGANMNPGLSGGSAARSGSSMSPNLNPGMSSSGGPGTGTGASTTGQGGTSR